MADPITASRLPELPNDGYATTREREMSDAMMTIIRGWERDRAGLLLPMVLGGRDKWRHLFIKAYKGIQAGSDQADAVYGYLVLLAAQPYGKRPRDYSTHELDRLVKDLTPQWEAEKRHLERMERWSPAQRTGLVAGGPSDLSESQMRDLIERVMSRNRGNPV